MSTKVKTKANQQIRIIRTSEIDQIIQIIKKQLISLDDSEIIKYLIGEGFTYRMSQTNNAKAPYSIKDLFKDAEKTRGQNVNLLSEEEKYKLLEEN